MLGGGEFVEALRAEEPWVCRGPARTPEELLAGVSSAHGATPEQIVGPSREQPVARARVVFCMRAREEAGQALGNPLLSMTHRGAIINFRHQREPAVRLRGLRRETTP